MEKTHIALAVEASGSTALPSPLPYSRKSLRRAWNQLPRCQRNLIIIGILAACVTFVFLLPGEQITIENRRLAFSGVFPFRSSHDSTSGASTQFGTEELDVDNLLKMENGDRSLPVAPVTVAPLIGEKILRPPPERLEESAQIKGPRLDYDEPAVQQQHLNKINIQEVNVNNIEVPVADDDANRGILAAVVLAPELLPGSNDVTINDFINRLDPASDAQRQHFHGATNERQEAVVAAFRHSWNGYKKYAWGHDNLKPLSQGSHDWFGLGLTIVDSLDTIYIMGLEEEFIEARDWVSEYLTFDINRDVNLFEVTIRILGGLLASYHLSGEKMFLKKSIELGNRLLPCFLSPSGIPYSDVNLGAMSAHSPKWSPDSSTSEVTTLQLEFRDLSRCTNVPIYETVVQVVNEKVHALDKNNGLVPIFINANTGTFRNYATISLGARGDSYYEYLLKQWIQTGRQEDDVLISDYIRAIDGALTQLMRRTPRDQHVYLGELINGKEFKPKMDHLTCYLPGTLLLGHKYGMPDSHLLLARDLLETCYQMYMTQPTHLAPEICHFALTDSEELEIYVKLNDVHNLLRPEFIESLYYFYALTGNRTYQNMGWNIFQAFEKYTKVAVGYSSIGNVKSVLNTRLRDMMESFWLGETLKYFYLLFSDNRKEIDLDKWVFNTEAHPLPVRDH